MYTRLNAVAVQLNCQHCSNNAPVTHFCDPTGIKYSVLPAGWLDVAGYICPRCIVLKAITVPMQQLNFTRALHG